MKLTLGFSTCPNDTFMFDALVNGRINTNGLDFEVTMADILHLNHAAIAGKLDIVKVSYNTYGLIRDDYALLNAGSAMGLGCGPLLIAREAVSIAELVAGNARIAIPGKNTTANLLLSYFESGLQNRQEMLFHEVMPAVKSGAADAGLIIHENRFTYQDEGLVCLQDLGAYWEAKTRDCRYHSVQFACGEAWERKSSPTRSCMTASPMHLSIRRRACRLCAPMRRS